MNHQPRSTRWRQHVRNYRKRSPERNTWPALSLLGHIPATPPSRSLGGFFLQEAERHRRCRCSSRQMNADQWSYAASSFWPATAREKPPLHLHLFRSLREGPQPSTANAESHGIPAQTDVRENPPLPTQQSGLLPRIPRKQLSHVSALPNAVLRTQYRAMPGNSAPARRRRAFTAGAPPPRSGRWATACRHARNAPVRRIAPAADRPGRGQ